MKLGKAGKIFEYIYDREQKQIRTKNLMLFCFCIAMVFISSLIVLKITKPDATVQRSFSSLGGGQQSESAEALLDKDVDGVVDSNSSDKENHKQDKPTKRQIQPIKNIKFQAQQVIMRGGEFDAKNSLPKGFEATGRLLTGVDTREKMSTYKIVLPFGASFQGGGQLPIGSMLFAKAKYPGKGKKVYLEVNGGVLPDGNNFDVTAQVLSKNSKQPGLIGEHHSRAVSRLFSSLGLSVVSGAADVLTEKEQVGGNAAAPLSAKSNIKNAALGGLAKATEAESSRQLGEMNSQQEYVTIDSGRDLLVIFTSNLKLGD